MERSYCAVLSGVSEAGSDLITELRSIVTIRFSFVTDLSKLENLLNFDSKCTHDAPGGHIVVPWRDPDEAGKWPIPGLEMGSTGARSGVPGARSRNFGRGRKF